MEQDAKQQDAKQQDKTGDAAVEPGRIMIFNGVRLSVGEPNSGGAGFKILRIAN